MEKLFYATLRHICVVLLIKLYIIFLSTKSNTQNNLKLNNKIYKWRKFMSMYILIASTAVTIEGAYLIYTTIYA